LLRLGIHVSIAGKIYNSVGRAKELGCNTMQIFMRNPRQWRKSSLNDEDIALFKKEVLKEKIKPVVVHIPYTLNLASHKPSFYKITIREFITDVKECDRLGVQYLVTHMGSYKGSTEEAGLRRVANALKKILKETKDTKTMILLENTSGSGSWLGYKFSHHKFILDELKGDKRVGVCLDTAHCWAAGYKIDDKEGVDSLLSEVDETAGIDRLKVIHLNDTQEPLGSLKDRHFAIGEGSIGRRGFKCILTHNSLKDVTYILETPKYNENEGDDIKNLETVKKLHSNSVK
tara:strand:- start:307 stop:1170 length:864 start_codon:yes stop_codon:yes gene_type:complete